MTLKLSVEVDRQARTLAVDGPGDRPMPFLVQIDDELVLVVGGAAPIDAGPYPAPSIYLWSVERGANGTIPAEHANDADVVPVVTSVSTGPTAPTPTLAEILASGNTTGGTAIAGADAAADSDDDGGDVTLSPGAGAGAGRNGLVILTGLPIEDPGVEGALWSDSGVLTVSAG